MEKYTENRNTLIIYLIAAMLIFTSIAEAVKLYPFPSQIIEITLDLQEKHREMELSAGTEKGDEISNNSLAFKVWVPWLKQAIIVIAGFVLSVILLLSTRRKKTAISLVLILSMLYLAPFLLKVRIFNINHFINHYKEFYASSMYIGSLPYFFLYEVAIPLLYILIFILSVLILTKKRIGK